MTYCGLSKNQKETGEYLAQIYAGKNMYKGNSFEKDLEFIKSVLGGNDEK